MASAEGSRTSEESLLSKIFGKDWNSTRDHAGGRSEFHLYASMKWFSLDMPLVFFCFYWTNALIALWVTFLNASIQEGYCRDMYHRCEMKLRLHWEACGWGFALKPWRSCCMWYKTMLVIVILIMLNSFVFAFIWYLFMYCFCFGFLKNYHYGPYPHS